MESTIERWLKVAFCGAALLGRPSPNTGAVTRSANRSATVVENALPAIDESYVPDQYELEENYADVMMRVVNVAKR
jgi:hypothetical protein